MSAPADRPAALRDVAAGGVLAAAAALYWWQSRAIPDSSLSDEVGPQALPVALAVGLATVAAIILLRGLAALRHLPAVSASGGEGGDHVASLPRALGFLAIGVGYVLITPVTGYVIGTALLIGAVAVYEGEAPTWRVAAVAVAAGFGFWAVFVKGLGTEQPVGWFW